MISAAIDLGGTRIKLGLLDENGLEYFKIITASPEKGLTNLLPILKDEITIAIQEINLKNNQLQGIGIAFPGLVNSKENKILSAPADKYQDAVNIGIAEWGHNNFNLPVVIENDANMALLGEWKYGAGKDCNNIVMVTLGTGIGTSVIVEGVPLRGVHFQAGCLGGHFTLDINAGRCICGNVGCIEMKASGRTLPDLLRNERIKIISETKNLDYKKIFELASAGNESANQIVEYSINIWGIALVNLIHTYDPEIIILSGGIISAEYPIIHRLKEYVDGHAWTPWGKVSLLKAKYPESAALFGAHYKLSCL